MIREGRFVLMQGFGLTPQSIVRQINLAFADPTKMQDLRLTKVISLSILPTTEALRLKTNSVNI